MNRCPTCLRVPSRRKHLTITQRVLDVLKTYYPEWMTTAALAARVEEISGRPVLLGTVRSVLLRNGVESRWYGSHSELKAHRDDRKEYRWE